MRWNKLKSFHSSQLPFFSVVEQSHDLVSFYLDFLWNWAFLWNLRNHFLSGKHLTNVSVFLVYSNITYSARLNKMVISNKFQTKIPVISSMLRVPVDTRNCFLIFSVTGWSGYHKSKRSRMWFKTITVNSSAERMGKSK